MLPVNIVPKADSFDWGYQTFGDGRLEAALAATKRFCSAMVSTPQQGRWLSILGKSGTGKSHLCKAATRFFRKHWEDRPIPGQDHSQTIWRCRGGRVDWRRAANDIRDGAFSLVPDMQETWFLGIDDIFAEQSTEFVTAKLCEILDARLGKWTVITSNKTLEQIAEIEVRIASRLKRGGSEVVSMTGVPDFANRSHPEPASPNERQGHFSTAEECKREWEGR